MKKKTVKNKIKKYAYGSGMSGLEGIGSKTGSMLQDSGMKGMGNMGMWGSLADGAIGIIDALSNPPQYQRQPTLNAMTMRNMVSPYGNFAFGGSIDDLDEDQLAELQEEADSLGVSVEDLWDEMQSQQESQESDEDDIPQEEDEVDETEEDDMFAYGGKIMSKRALKKFAMGGTPIEVEHNEVVETPDGEVTQVKGATHEEGGIDINVPKGTKVFSDRLVVDGKSMQQRKLGRERGLKRLEKMLSKNPSDKLTKNSYMRTLENFEKEEAQDMALQKVANQIYPQPQKQGQAKYGYGGGPGKPYFDKTGWHYDLSALLNGDPQSSPYFDKTGWHYPNMKNSIKNLGLSDVGTPQNQENNLPTNTPPKFSILGDTPTIQLNGENQSPYLWDNFSNTPPVNPNAPKQYAVDNTGTPVNNTDPIIPLKRNVDRSLTPMPKTATNELQVANPDLDEGGFTVGDYAGMAGNLFNAIAPIINTKNNARGNKPNINRFLGFGRKALDTNQFAQDSLARTKANEMTDINTAANSQAMRVRNSTSSVNTLRALDSTVDMAKSKSIQAANDSFEKQMMGLMINRGQLENEKDLREMTGEQQRDLEDKMDRDNYYSNMAENLVNFGTNVQGLGKNLNTSSRNKADLNLLANEAQNNIAVDAKGNVVNKFLTKDQVQTYLDKGWTVNEKGMLVRPKKKKK